ncbi:2-C-methyl-D-erythritol 4-phosphate cytidylyltransferase [Desulfonispora thiosulfatigenes DSM 11270]|uniref:2-C-methyl-D-erythritol 4-phosphate cytidylyltransferase n=1 Tax=Desulfonispora thiosulfatigenes DSM 11270 TaxID=656914 RepID=A0A1W1UTJ2_DESTI|nr:2-C-methyl-D-erythritol 4-phosphate cytidylyltransferase [Desulfonispora thiosulfatigenes DSM 11270]
MFDNVVILLAAGQGKRMNSDTNKQYMHLFDKPILAHTLDVFQNHPLIDEIIVVTRQEELDFCQKEIVERYNFSKVNRIVIGGKERQESVFNALRVVDKENCLVVVHDGARPLVTPRIISEVIENAKITRASIVAVPVKDTIKRVNSSKLVVETLKREELWAVQTPQVFTKEIITKAHERADRENYLGTDDASLVEKIGQSVNIVLGSYENIKITTQEDLDIAINILRRRKACE